MIQIHTEYVTNVGKANEYLRLFPQIYPKRKILNASLIPDTNFPAGWFLMITYEI